jgi:hypothetical protein
VATTLTIGTALAGATAALLVAPVPTALLIATGLALGA